MPWMASARRQSAIVAIGLTIDGGIVDDRVAVRIPQWDARGPTSVATTVAEGNRKKTMVA